MPTVPSTTPLGPGAKRGRLPLGGVRNGSGHRLVGVESPIEETYWTAKEWAQRTRVPYRTILAAAARGELEAVRPSGTAHGAVLISESSWSAWLRASRLRSRPPIRIAGRRGGEGRSLSDLALS
jgi:excisionase family DNA binding protein